MKAAMVAICLLSLAIAYMGYTYWQSRADLARVHAIKDDNQKKDREIKKLAEKLIDLETKNNKVQQQQQEIKHLMGLPVRTDRQTTSSRGGMGGVARNIRSLDANALLSEADRASELVELQEGQTEKLLDQVESNQKYYRGLPNYWPTIGRITSVFGMRRSPFGRNQEFHDGIDIAADRGTPVLAAGDGVVVYASWKNGYGRLVQIDHKNGLKTWYGHNSSILVTKGQRVKKGQKIALVGSSGRSTGPHVHFIIEKKGQPINPSTYLP
ncbi:MAG: M23 family metallopeptidase [Chitinophagales bacterium]